MSKQSIEDYDVEEFVNSLTVHQDDEDLNDAMKVAEMTALLCDDPWLTRAAYFGLAGSMERQIKYLGGELIPNAETKKTRLGSKGVRGESFVKDSWFGNTNADSKHEADETPEQDMDETDAFILGLQERMRCAAIIMVVNIKQHDDVSNDLAQYTYGQIRGSGNAKRHANKPSVKGARTRARNKKKAA
jgi:hypothetical protein